MIPDFFLLAATDPNSSAYRAGEIAGSILGLLILIVVPVLFIISLVKFITTKKRGWLVGLIVSGLLSIAFIVLVLVTAYNGYKTGIAKAKNATPSIRATGSAKVVEVPESDLSLTLPGHWVELSELNEEATLSTGNTAKEEYLIVIPENKIDFDGSLEDFSKITASGIFDNLTNSSISEPKPLLIQGLSAIQYEISGTIDHTKVSYLHTSVIGEKYFYQVLGWTVLSRKSQAFDVFHEVINSMEEK